MRYAAVFFLLALLAVPVVAAADSSLIPLPVYDTTRNGGSEYGFMPVWLLKEQNEYVYGIIAPSVVYNGNTGTNFTFRYLGYPTLTKNYRIFVNRSTKVDQEYTGEYWDTKLWDGRFKFYGKFTFFRDSTYRFFGLGATSRADAETNYSDMELAPTYTLGYRLGHNFIASFGQQLRWVMIRPGTVKTLPYIQAEFPDVEGVRGGCALENRLTLTYDSRDDEVYPAKGTLANVYGEVGGVFSHGGSFFRTGLDARKYISFRDKRFTTVIKGAVQATIGHDVPFFEKSTIGGENSLRGFGNYRFRDNGFILINVEERIRLFKLHIFGVWSDWQAAPFVDIGRVYNSLGDKFFRRYQINPGVGFRAVVQPNVVGRVDFGVGRDGLATFVGLDFPF